MTVYADITETIGETPIVRLNRISPPGSDIYVKIERSNPGGSIKDRAVLSMINDAEARGVLRKGGTIVEPTSGNTGISIALIAAARGYKAVIIMPDTMSKERISSMRAYGAEVILSPGSKGMAGAVELANQIAEERDGFILDQFGNLMNTAAHRTGTGREILRDIPDVDLVFSGFGTGGTASGIALAFKDAGVKAKVIGTSVSKADIENGIWILLLNLAPKPQVKVFVLLLLIQTHRPVNAKIRRSHDWMLRCKIYPIGRVVANPLKLSVGFVEQEHLFERRFFDGL